jgi:hypothetical protein
MHGVAGLACVPELLPSTKEKFLYDYYESRLASAAAVADMSEEDWGQLVARTMAQKAGADVPKGWKLCPDPPAPQPTPQKKLGLVEILALLTAKHVRPAPGLLQLAPGAVAAVAGLLATPSQLAALLAMLGHLPASLVLGYSSSPSSPKPGHLPASLVLGYSASPSSPKPGHLSASMVLGYRPSPSSPKPGHLPASLGRV